MSTKLTADLNAVQNAPIELEYLNGDLNIIQKLDDEPNDVGGLTSAQLKAKFDEAGNAIKDYINNDLIPAILAADATEAERAAAEASRVSAESARATAETARAKAEEQRVTNENTRKSNETDRGNAESARATAEQNRTTAEGARANAEAQRVQAETSRKTVETDRAEAESKRESAESSREESETRRGTSESARQNAEQARKAAEQQRQANEQARQTAENARNSWSEYSAAAGYVVGNKVSSGGSSYVCIKPCKGIAPPNATYWQLIAQRGNDGKGAPSDDTPKAPGTASAGSAETYSRSDHVHPKQTVGKADVGLGNVDNVKQYSADNPPPYPATTKPIKGDGSGGLAAAVPGSDYIASGNITKQTLVATETTPTENYAINWVYG